MALLMPTPVTPARSLQSARTSSSSLFPFSRLLSDVVDIDDFSDDESKVSLPLAEFGWDPVVVAACLSRGKTVHSKLLLEGRPHVSGVTDGHSVLKPSKLLPRPQPPSVYRPCVRRTSLEREDSLSNSDTLLPVPSPRPKPLEEVASPPEPAAFLATRPQSTPPTSPCKKRSPGPLFAASTPACPSPLSPPKSKRRRVTPPVSKYNLASAPGRTRVSLAVVVPRNLVNIPPFYPPRARLEAEFALFGYLSHLHECARRGPPPPSPVPAHFDPVRPAARRGHARNPSHGTLHSLRSLRSLRNIRSVQRLRPRSSMTLRSLRPLHSLRRLSSRSLRDEHALQLSHLGSQIETERLRAFERIQELKRIIVDNGGCYSEKDMRKAQEYGAKLAKDTLPRILHIDLEFDDWVFV